MSRGVGAAAIDLLRLSDAPDLVTAADSLRRLEEIAGMVEVMGREGALVWLHRRLHDLGLTAGATIAASIRSSALQEHVWAARVEEECDHVFTLLESSGIECIAIKGPARRIAAARYPYADARITSDVDLLIPADAAQAAREMLTVSGYERVYPDSLNAENHFHLPTVRRLGGITVELHTSTDPWTPGNVAWSRQSGGASLVEWRGHQVRVPAATELLWHSIAHAFIDGAEGFRLRTFLDGAVIISSNEPIQWEVIRERIAVGEIRQAERDLSVPADQVRRWLATAARLAGADIPADLGADGSFAIERLLDWKFTVAGASLGRAARERLVEEATRAEFSMPITPPFRNDNYWGRFRRRAASRIARLGYLGWRLPQPQG